MNDVDVLLGMAVPDDSTPVLDPDGANPNTAGEAKKGVAEADGTEFVANDPMGSGGLIEVVLLGVGPEADNVVDNDVLGEDSFGSRALNFVSVVVEAIEVGTNFDVNELVPRVPDVSGF